MIVDEDSWVEDTVDEDSWVEDTVDEDSSVEDTVDEDSWVDVLVIVEVVNKPFVVMSAIKE